MSACLFMKNYSEWNEADLRAEQDALLMWLEHNKNPKGTFQCDWYAGNIHNLYLVTRQIKYFEINAELPKEEIDLDNWMSREGAYLPADSHREKIIGAILHGYNLAKREAFEPS